MHWSQTYAGQPGKTNMNRNMLLNNNLQNHIETGWPAKEPGGIAGTVQGA